MFDTFELWREIAQRERERESVRKKHCGCHLAALRDILLSVDCYIVLLHHSITEKLTKLSMFNQMNAYDYEHHFPCGNGDCICLPVNQLDGGVFVFLGA